MSRVLFAISAAILGTICSFAAVIGTNVAALPLTEERIATLPAAQQAEWRKYLARSVEQMRVDRAALDAEVKKAGLRSPVIPPSASAAKSIPLDKPAEWYATAEARHIANIVVSFQTPAGGWSKNLNLTDHPRAIGEHYAGINASPVPGVADFDTSKDPKWEYVGTLDNDATTTEIWFLAKVAAANGNDTDAKAWHASVVRGIDYILAAQYPNGGWPQIWPLQGGYHDAITFNDDAMTRALGVLLDVSNGEAGIVGVPAALRARARTALERGIGIILATQVVSNGQRTAWGQQYDMLDLKPVGARNYEMPSLSSGESASLLLFLMKLQKPTAAEVDAVRAGAAWLKRVEIYGKAFERGANGRMLVSAPGAGPIWSRFYEIGSDRPIFGDRDKSIHDDVNEISLERRNGYSWYNAGAKAALDEFREVERGTAPMMGDLTWSPAEKAVARRAFNQALEREFEAVIQKTKERAAKIRAVQDLWKLEDWLGERRRNIDQTFDYRYSVLPQVFGILLRDRRLTEDDLQGRGPDKLDFIRRVASL